MRIGVGGGGGGCFFFFFFFKQKTAYEMCGRDWSSDVCSSDLGNLALWVAKFAHPIASNRVIGWAETSETNWRRFSAEPSHRSFSTAVSKRGCPDRKSVV